MCLHKRELGYSKNYVCIKTDVTNTLVSKDPLDQALKYTSPNLSIQELQQRQTEGENRDLFKKKPVTITRESTIYNVSN